MVRVQHACTRTTSRNTKERRTHIKQRSKAHADIKWGRILLSPKAGDRTKYSDAVSHIVKKNHTKNRLASKEQHWRGQNEMEKEIELNENCSNIVKNEKHGKKQCGKKPN